VRNNVRLHHSFVSIDSGSVVHHAEMISCTASISLTRENGKRSYPNCYRLYSEFDLGPTIYHEGFSASNLVLWQIRLRLTFRRISSDDDDDNDEDKTSPARPAGRANVACTTSTTDGSIMAGLDYCGYDQSASAHQPPSPPPPPHLMMIIVISCCSRDCRSREAVFRYCTTTT
jgi:hypothetical protein